MAVYTEVTDEQLRDFLAQYAIGELIAYRGIAEGVENSNYSLRTSQGDFILTLYEKRVDPADLPWFLGLMRHLAAQDIPCPLPIAGRDGDGLRRLCGRHAALTSFLPGVWPRRSTVDQARALGRMLARLHMAGQHYAPVRLNQMGIASWRPLAQKCADSADRVQPGLGAAIAAALDQIEAHWPVGLPTGQIHADLFPDNVFFLGPDISGVIDFYFACTDILAYDLAICWNAWCFEIDGSFHATKARAMLQGYSSIRALDHAEHAALPLLAQGAALRFLLTRLYDWVNTPPGALVVRKDPLDYLRRLRFFASVPEFATLGL